MAIAALITATPVKQALPTPDAPGAAMARIRAGGNSRGDLADDSLEGRGTGTRGYDIAAKYMASQFEEMGPFARKPLSARPVAIADQLTLLLVGMIIPITHVQGGW